MILWAATREIFPCWHVLIFCGKTTWARVVLQAKRTLNTESLIVILHFFSKLSTAQDEWSLQNRCTQLLTEAMCPACIIQALIYTDVHSFKVLHNCWFHLIGVRDFNRKRDVFGFLSLAISIWSLFQQHSMFSEVCCCCLFPLKIYLFFALLELLLGWLHMEEGTDT